MTPEYLNNASAGNGDTQSRRDMHVLHQFIIVYMHVNAHIHTLAFMANLLVDVKVIVHPYLLSRLYPLQEVCLLG